MPDISAKRILPFDNAQAFSSAELARAGLGGAAIVTISAPLPEFSLLPDLIKSNYQPANIFINFIDRNPAFKTNTSGTYLTEIFRYLESFFFKFGSLPNKYAPLVAAAQIANHYLQASQEVSLKSCNLFAKKQVIDTLSKKTQNLWQLANETTPRFRANKQTSYQPESMLSCADVAQAGIASTPVMGISREHQAAVNWLFNRYNAFFDAQLYQQLLSTNNIGRGMRAAAQARLSSATICLRLVALNHFRQTVSAELGFSFDEPLPNPPRVADGGQVVLTQSELSNVSDSLNQRVNEQPSKYVGRRNQLMFNLFYTTGIRVSALINIKIKDINFSSGTLKVLEKNSKYRHFPLHSTTVDLLEQYLNLGNWPTKNSQCNKSSKLFLSKSGADLNRSQVFSILENIGRRADLTERLGPHTIRRSLACALLDNGAPPHAIQQLLGHASYQTTLKYYAAYAARDALETLQSFHPFSSKTAPARIVSKVVDFVPAGRDEVFLKLVKPSYAKATKQASPEFLRQLCSKTKSKCEFLEDFSNSLPNLRRKTREIYRSDVTHFVVGRLHNLEMPVADYKLHHHIVLALLVDRLDWLVRTEVIDNVSGMELYKQLGKLKVSAKPVLSQLDRSQSAISRLLADVDETTHSDGYYSLKFPNSMILDDNKFRGQREQQVINYIGQFINRGNRNVFFAELFRPDHSMHVYSEMIDRGTFKETVARHLSALRKFSDFLKIGYDISANQVDKDLLPPVVGQSKRPQMVLTVAEVGQLEQVLKERCASTQGDEHIRALRDRAIFLLLYTTAVRVGALVKLRANAIDFTRNVVYFKEKGGREAELPLMPSAKVALQKYFVKSPPTNKYIFTSKRGNSIDARSVSRILNNAKELANLQLNLRGRNSLSPHTLRRSAAVHMHSNGASIPDLSKLLGHKNYAQTADYVKHGTIDQRKMLEDCLHLI